MRPNHGYGLRIPSSVRVTVVARTLIRTSSAAGTGRGTSSRCNTSGGPYLSQTTAFIESAQAERRGLVGYQREYVSHHPGVSTEHTHHAVEKAPRVGGSGQDSQPYAHAGHQSTHP